MKPTQIAPFNVLIVVIFFLLSCSLFFNQHFVASLPNYLSTKYSLVSPVDLSTLSNVPQRIADITPSELCVLDNEDIIFREGTILKRFYASSQLVTVYLGKGLSTAEGIDTTLSKGTVKYLLRNPNSKECSFIDYDGARYRVRTISSDDNTVKTIANITQATCMTIDEDGNIFTCEANKIRMVNMTTGNIVTVAGTSTNPSTIPIDGASTSGNIRTATSMVARNGIVYFTVFNSIMKIQNASYYRVAGSWSTCISANPFNVTYNGLASSACLNSPKLVAVINNEIYFTDKSDIYLRKINQHGMIELVLGNGLETINFERNYQLSSNVTLSIKRISIIPMNGYLKYYISLLDNIIKVDRNSYIELVAGFTKPDFSYSVNKYGLQLELVMQPIKTYRNGDFLFFSKDKKILYKMSRRTGLMKPLMNFEYEVWQYVVDKSTREDLYIVFLIEDTDPAIVYNHLIYKFNIYSKSMQLIAGSRDTTKKFQFDGQSSLDISITKGVFSIKYFNGSLYYTSLDMYQLMQVNLTSLTVKKIMGLGYSQGESLSGLYSDAKSVEFDTLNQIVAHPITGTLFLRTDYLISYIDDQNRVMPYIGKKGSNFADFLTFPAPADLITTSTSASMAFHPNTQTLYFVYNKLYLLEYVNSTYVRCVFQAPTEIVSFVIRKSNGYIYFSSNTIIYEYNSVTNSVNLFLSGIPTNALVGLIDDTTLIYVKQKFNNPTLYNLATGTSSTKTLAYLVDPARTDVCFVYNFVNGPNADIYVSCGSYIFGGGYYIAKVKTSDRDIVPVTPISYFGPFSFTFQNGTLIIAGDQGVYKINATKNNQIAGQGYRTPIENQPINSNGWTLGENGDVYFLKSANANPIKRAVLAEGVVINVIGNGTIDNPTSYTSAGSSKLSDFFKDGTYYGEIDSKTSYWYSPLLDRYYSKPSYLSFSLGSATITQDEDIVFIESASPVTSIYSYLVDCERDKYGYCLQNFTCYGIFYNDSSCSNHGDCTKQDFSECYDNYYSENCSITTCNGIFSNQSNVCNGHGKCNYFDNCNCEPYYYGDDCNVTICYDVYSNDSSVCSGHGYCIDKDSCQCDENFFGCNEIASNQSLNVSSSGNDTLGSNSSMVNNYTSSDNSTFNNFTYVNNSSAESNISNNSTISNSTSLDNSTNPNNSSNNMINATDSSLNSTLNSTLDGNNTIIDTNSTNLNNTITNSTIFSNSTLETNNTLSLNNTKTITNSTNTSNSTLENTNSINNSSMSNTTLNYINNTLTNTTIESNNTLNSTLNSTLNNSTLDGNITILDTNSTYLNNTIQNNSTIYNNTVTNNTQVENSTLYNNNTNVSNSTSTMNTNNSTTTQPVIVQCFGYEANDSRVCSSHGNCISNNTCQCNSLYDGLECENKKITCFGLSQDDYMTCSGHGSCLSEDACQCNSGYIGDRCFLSVLSQPNFNSQGNTLEFHFNTSTAISNRVLDCRKVVNENSLSLLGQNPLCYWNDGNFFIELGGQYSLSSQSNISLNINSLNVISLSKTSYTSLLVLPSDNPVKPIINISYKNVISPCEQISIDASGSYCGDLKPVKFIWSIESSPDLNLNLEQFSFGDLNSTLTSNSISISGRYIFGLIVESSLSGARSEKQLIEIVKSSIPNPTLSLLTNKMSLVNVEKSSLPIVVKKSIELPSCYFENKQFDYIWKQVSGPATAISKFNSNSNTTLVVQISSKARDLMLNAYVSNLNTNRADVIVESSDPDNVDSVESWSWSCFDRVINQACQDATLLNILNQCAISKSAACQIPKGNLSKVSLTLNIQKGLRAISKSMDIDFPKTEMLIPPVISLISVYPNRFKVLKEEILSLQLSVILGGDEKQTKEEDMIREWSINGNSLTNSIMTSKMSTDTSVSSSLILSLSDLLEDGEYEIEFKVSDRRNALSSKFTYKFKIVKSPKSCLCYINPSTGYALETQFSFSCPGCQNAEKSIDFVFGFMDDKSGTKIPLYNLGEKFASYLPSPYASDKMDVFVDIFDLDTGASVEFIKPVQVIAPSASSLLQIKSKVRAWQLYASSLLPSDSAKLVFNSATISRTSELMISKLTRLSRLISEQDIAYGLRDEMLESMTVGLNQRNPLELISDIHFRVYSFGLESLASNCDSVDSLPFDKLLNLTEKLIVMATKN